MSATVGIDVGGTFTDVAIVFPDGSVVSSKVLSNSDNPALGVEEAIAGTAADANAIARIVHGTTVVTNLLLERRGARVVVCTTAGFTDITELRRQERASLYDLTQQHPPPLVLSERMVGVHERMTPTGVRVPLTREECDRVSQRIMELSPEAVAICFLHSYQDGSHEAMLGEALRRAFDERGISCQIACSHEVFPEIREYERMSTVAAEVYARPALRRYLDRLTERLDELGMPSLQVMTSAGGTLPVRVASERAASLALSGPAGGVTGAALILRALGIEDALTIDIGGTSADVGLIVDGEPLIERGSAIGGVPISLPRVLVEAVAAGGGSIGWIDDGGALRAGPESAGASPGPACYGRGGTRPTLTDAHVVVGNIAAGEWSGGVTVSRELALEALAPLAAQFGVSPERAAQALIRTADATMARALRRISVQRGIDPRDVALVAFGGGGPLHACGLAMSLGMHKVVIPPFAGVLSAVGLAIAPERYEQVSGMMADLSRVSAAEVEAWIASTGGHRIDGLSGGGQDGRRYQVQRWLRSRYSGQGHELELPLYEGDDGESLSGRFSELHMALTGFVLDRPVECISMRYTHTGETARISFRRGVRGGAVAPDDHHDDGLEMDRTVVGPFVIGLPDATMYVASGWTAHSLPIGGWMMERNEVA